MTPAPRHRRTRSEGGLTRRQLLKASAALELLSMTPLAFARAASLARDAGEDGPILVVVQLTGGNDGLNTVVPWADDRYHRARPVLAVSPQSVLRLDDHSGLHPSLAALMPLWDEGALSIVQGVGYPEPNRSHFRSMEIWHTASTDDSPPHAGWLGRAAGRLGRSGELAAAAVGERQLPLALAGARGQAPTISSIDELTLDDRTATGTTSPLQAACRSAKGRDGAAAFIAEAYRGAFETARRLEQIGRVRRAGDFPASSLGRSLSLAATLIDARLGARVLYATQGGYDTHAGQDRTHPELLRDLARSLAAFQARIDEQGHGGRVLTLVFSEFGRRIHENASGGTDHGAGNPVLLLGRPTGGGLWGERPDLGGPIEKDVPGTTDFRRVYATALEWLGVDPGVVIPGEHSPLPLIG
jgi:uncharacterized protein (DUF1501 family)